MKWLKKILGEINFWDFEGHVWRWSGGLGKGGIVSIYSDLFLQVLFTNFTNSFYFLSALIGKNVMKIMACVLLVVPAISLVLH